MGCTRPGPQLFRRAKSHLFALYITRVGGSYRYPPEALCSAKQMIHGSLKQSYITGTLAPRIQQLGKAGDNVMDMKLGAPCI